jgi:hypothetical protein
MESNISIIYRWSSGRSPYRDHHVSKIILVSGGLDTPLRGYSTIGEFYK